MEPTCELWPHGMLSVDYFIFTFVNTSELGHSKLCDRVTDRQQVLLSFQGTGFISKGTLYPM